MSLLFRSAQRYGAKVTERLIARNSECAIPSGQNSAQSSRLARPRGQSRPARRTNVRCRPATRSRRTGEIGQVLPYRTRRCRSNLLVYDHDDLMAYGAYLAAKS